jgi:hypothetical protein
MVFSPSTAIAMTPLRLLCFLIACAIVAPASSQTAAPSDAAIAKPNCMAPEDFPGSLSSDRQRQQWQKEYTAYSDCMKKFINEQKALAEPYLKAYNSAIDEYNAKIKVLNEQIEKAKAAK